MMGTTHYTYDTKGNMISETNGEGSTQRYEYNAMGQRTKIVDADDGTYAYIYNLAGRLIQETNQAGNVQTYTYTDGTLTSKTDFNEDNTRYQYTRIGCLQGIDYDDEGKTPYATNTIREANSRK